MGNHPSVSNEKFKKFSLHRKSSSTSESDLKPSPSNVAVENLSKILAEKSALEESVDGISCKAFSTQLFSRYFDLGQRIYTYFHFTSKSPNQGVINVQEFINQVDKFLATITDNEITNFYMNIYMSGKPEFTNDSFRNLLMDASSIAFDHYPKGPETCEDLDETIETAVAALFHGKESVPPAYATRWISENCPYLLPGVHKYVVHVLTTAHRMQDSTLEPILEKDKSKINEDSNDTLPLSLIWLLSTSLPTLYTGQQFSNAASPLLSANQILLKMMAALIPSHWTPLYNSNSNGLGSNRFLTHVLHYKSPTLSIFYTNTNLTFLVATSMEWRESQNYWGGPDCIVMEISPEYHVIERGEKLMYLNFKIRGYPLGFRAGSDPKNPVLIVDGDLCTVTYKKITYTLDAMQVWGCGKEEVKEAQLEIKKWQVKDAEKQRVVKLTAEDWLDHPDRYLLEMNGRTNYTEKLGPEPKN